METNEKVPPILNEELWFEQTELTVEEQMELAGVASEKTPWVPYGSPRGLAEDLAPDRRKQYGKSFINLLYFAAKFYQPETCHSADVLEVLLDQALVGVALMHALYARLPELAQELAGRGDFISMYGLGFNGRGELTKRQDHQAKVKPALASLLHYIDTQVLRQA